MNGSVYYVIDLGAEREVAAVWIEIYAFLNRKHYTTGDIWVGNDGVSVDSND